MDAYELAMKMQKEGEKYYREQAEKTKSEGIKNIFEMMADDEKDHQEIIKNIKKNYIDCNAKMKIEDVNTVFSERLKENKSFEDEEQYDDFLYAKININETVEAYRHALRIQKEAIDFYKKQIDKADDECDKRIFERLMIEEEKHYQTIDNMLDHVTKSERWLEDARFTHLEDF